jgi:pSer/pThr/pTyr-binding forkhead associated (FHA) protein
MSRPVVPPDYAFNMNSFLNACGISGPLQIAVRGPSTNESGVRLLHQPFALIGRDQRSDIPLDHRLVSRRHVYLQVVEGQAFWIDLDSRSGTMDAGQPSKFGWLGAGRTIRVGPYELQRLTGHQSGPNLPHPAPGMAISPLSARSYANQPLPDVSLEFLNGPSRSACWPMNRVMSLIGSAGGCKFRLADPSVAPFHCSLMRSPSGLWVVDLLGPDGIGVNDALVRYALLADNDVLKVGRYRIRIRSRFPGRGGNPDADIDRRVLIPGAGPPSPYSIQAASQGDVPDIAGLLNPGQEAESGSSLRDISPVQPSTQASLVEWMPPALSGLSRLEKGDLAESVLVPLVNQFGAMQQQMMDQFQHTIAMLVHMFGSLHRDQMDVIREELDQIRELTKEFQALKLELTAESRKRDSGASTAAAPAPVDNTKPPTALSLGVQASPLNLTARRVGLQGTKAFADGPRAVGSKSLAPSREDGHEEAGIPLTTSQPQARAGDEGQDADRDVMVWLHHRMMSLQQERETRWQRILKMLPGLS